MKIMVNKTYSVQDIKAHQKRLLKYLNNKDDVVVLSEIMYYFSPDEFEYFIAYYYQNYKWYTSLVQWWYDDEWVDVIWNKWSKQILIQCKKYITSNVNKKDMWYFYWLTSDRQNWNCELIYASTSRYTPNAKEFALNKWIEILDYKNIVDIANMIDWLDFDKYMRNNWFDVHIPINKRKSNKNFNTNSKSSTNKVSYFDSIMKNQLTTKKGITWSYFDELMWNNNSIEVEESESYFEKLMKEK